MAILATSTKVEAKVENESIHDNMSEVLNLEVFAQATTQKALKDV